LFEIFLAVPYYFAFGDEMKLVKNDYAGGDVAQRPVRSRIERVGFVGAGNPHRHGARGVVQAGRARAIFAGEVRGAGGGP